MSVCPSVTLSLFGLLGASYGRVFGLVLHVLTKMIYDNIIYKAMMSYARDTKANMSNEEAASKIALNLMDHWIHCNVYTKSHKAVKDQVKYSCMRLYMCACIYKCASICVCICMCS